MIANCLGMLPLVLAPLLGVHLFHSCMKEAGVRILAEVASLGLMKRYVFLGL
jgi:hypothetical protein